MSRDPLKHGLHPWGDLSLLSGGDRSVAFTRLPLQPLESGCLRFAMQFWDERRGARLAPRRRDFDPWDLTPILPLILLVDVLRSPLDFRCRLAGTRVCEIHGVELTGRCVRDLLPKRYGDRVWQEYAELVERREPQHCAVEYTNRFDLQRRFTVLRLPLSSDGQSVDKIMVVHDVD